MTADADTPTPEDQSDDEENTGISAGYTYFGQFIDHDLTFDPASSLQRQDDPDGLVDYRTPRFDLDNVYGRGPDDQPYLYRQDGIRLRLGAPLTGNVNDPKARGVPRMVPEGNEPARAIIGDPRNDENVIVSQLQASMLRFHNRMADVLGSSDFEAIQRQVRWHYQWAVLHDFLPTIIDENDDSQRVPHLGHGTSIVGEPPPQLTIDCVASGVDADARRVLGGGLPVRALDDPPELPDQRDDLGGGRSSRRARTCTSNLGGFRPIPSDWALDWQFFVDLGTPAHGPPPRTIPTIRRSGAAALVQDRHLTREPTRHLPTSVPVDPSSFGLRNLERGRPSASRPVRPSPAAGRRATPRR